MINFIMTAVALVVLVPFTVYLSVKFGTYAHYRGRQLFLEKEASNGENA